jgi:aryl-alcohol dehydrogenase-like predicted oxidoreductase
VRGMDYRQHAGETLSEIGLGCYALSGAYGPRDPDEFMQVVRRAYELGVTFFDTADVYGPAETILGQAIGPFREKVLIATKVGARSDGKPDCSPEHIMASCEASLERLETDVIDLYQTHFNDPATPVAETVGALERLRAAGKIRRYGVGHLPLERLDEYMTAGDIFSALVELSAAARGAREKVLPLCRQRGVGVLAFSVTGRGLLTGRIKAGHAFEEGDIRQIDALFQRERFRSGLRIAGTLKAIGRRHNRTAVQVAIAWVLAQPGIICALTGTTSLAHLEENLAVSSWQIPADEMGDLGRFLEDEDARLREAQIRQLVGILQEPRPAEDAMVDLVYALETLIELDVAGETDILPLFHRLLGSRGMESENARCEREAIQAELGERYLATLRSLGADEKSIPPIHEREG